MTHLKNSLIAILSLLAISCTPKKEETNSMYPIPEWAKHVVWYQIFPERFNNGDTTNEPTLESIQGSWPHTFRPDWKPVSWTSDWYKPDSTYTPNEYYGYNIQARRYGGDLQGILDKLDYLQDLGINAIYFNPLNDAPSMHKYDARNYRHVDVNFGPDPDGDRKIMKEEDPVDPSTWQWTSADKMFLRLIQELHKRKIRIILDYSWNHTGTKFWAWQDILKNGEMSKYADWYEIKQFDNPNTPEDEFDYAGWAGVKDLPELKKVDVVNRVNGQAYEGNILPAVKEHIFNVTKRWMDPNGDGKFDDGVDGFRLDVAEQIGLGFWRDYRKFTRSVNPECLLVGEIWWDKWPDTLIDPRPYVVKGDVFDIIMFYHAYQPARDFFAKSVEYGGAEKLEAGWNNVTEGISYNTIESMMMMSASHDAPRLLTSFYNKNRYKYNCKPGEDNGYKTGKPDEETYNRVKLYLAYQYVMPGAPQIWNGDEMGMWGADDPDCRKPLWWSNLNFDNESSDPYKVERTSYEVGFNKDLNDYYKQLIHMRTHNPVLSTGDLKFVKAEGDLLIVERSSKEGDIMLIINNSDEPLALPSGFSVIGKDLITGDEISMHEGEDLSPLSYYILNLQ